MVAGGAAANGGETAPLARIAAYLQTAESSTPPPTFPGWQSTIS